MVNFFGERRNDPTGLLNREVWLKFDKGDVSLQIPESLSWWSVAKERGQRRAVSTGLKDWDGRIFSGYYTDGFISLFSVLVGAFGMFSLASATSFLFMFGTAFVGVTMLLLVSVLVFLILDATHPTRTVPNPVLAVGFLLAIVACISGEVGLIEYTVPPQNGEFTTTISNAIPTMGATYLFVIGLFKGRELVGESVSWIGEKKDALKKWYQKKKGVEYVKT